jgi:hypothetical protein
MINVKDQNYNDLKYICDDFEKYLLFLKDTIKLPDYWNVNDAFELEIKKSFIRGALRYSKKTNAIIQFIQSQIHELKLKNINYITPIYPMVHLINDRVEGGGFHYDDEKNVNFYTFWFPMTDNKYSPISIFGYQNKLIDRFAKIIIKLKLPYIFKKKLYASKGNFFLWDGKTIHAGNINNSESMSCACQLKITEKKYEYESSLNLNFPKEIDFDVIKQEDILREFNLFYEFINLIYKNKSQREELTVNFLKNTKRIKKYFSFSLSVLSQRILTNKKYFKKIDDDFIRILDELSLLTGAENLISLKRLLRYFNGDKNKLLKNLEEKDFFNISKKIQIYFSNHNV